MTSDPIDALVWRFFDTEDPYDRQDLAAQLAEHGWRLEFQSTITANTDGSIEIRLPSNGEE